MPAEDPTDSKRPSQYTEPGQSNTLTVVGLGTMGSGISELALSRGFTVRAVDADAHRTAEGIDRIKTRIERHVRANIMPSSLLQVAAANLQSSEDISAACENAEIVIEAVPESWEAKEPVLRAISLATPRVIASNTSSLPIDKLAEFVEDPSRLIGVHFFNPAEWIPGVEVIPGVGTAGDLAAQVFGFLRRLGKVPALVKSSPGFLANRLQLALFMECLRCVEEGLATPEDVDTVVSSTFGFRLGAYGPFAIADMAGLDVYAGILDLLEERFGQQFGNANSLRKLVSEGHYGLKTGEGYQKYSSDTVSQALDRRDATYERLLGVLDYQG